MTREQILKRLGEAYPLLERRYGVSSLRLFGSVVRDEAGPESDVDLLVEFASEPSFDAFMGLKLYLDDLLERRVDLVSPQRLPAWSRSSAEQEAVCVA